MAQSIVNIPIRVAFRVEHPCTWQIVPIKSQYTLKQGKRVYPIRLIPVNAPPQLIMHISDETPNVINFDAASDAMLERRSLDPWSARREFLAAHSDEELVEFLNETGRFFKSMPRNGVSFEDVREWQGLFQSLLKTSPARWASKLAKFSRDPVKGTSLDIALELPIKFVWRGASPHGVITTTNTLSAIFATILVDHLRKAEVKFCARPDCGKEFEVTSRHKRVYCSQRCAHLESVRRMRQRRRKQSGKRRVDSPGKH